jgi:hypothetical protein
MRKENIPKTTKQLYDFYKGKGTQASIEEITTELRIIVGLYSRVFIVVDALDEYHASDYEGLIEFLSAVFTLQSQGPVKIFATSRYIPEIASQFDGDVTKEIRAQDEDVVQYVDGQIPKLLRPTISKHASNLKDTVRQEIVKAADGMWVHPCSRNSGVQANIFRRFLLARLYMESLMSWLTPGDLKRALHNLPKKLDETYEQAMKRIEGQEEGSREPAKRLLGWISSAKSKLNTSEIQHALAIFSDLNMTDLDRDFLLDVEVLTSICAGLVTVDHKNNSIRLVHYITQEFFKRNAMFQNEKPGVAVACVTYLSFGVFDSGFCSTDDELEERLRLYPLYTYASQNWGYHCFEAPENKDGEKLVKFLQNENQVASSCQASLARKPYLVDSSCWNHCVGLYLIEYRWLRIV